MCIERFRSVQMIKKRSSWILFFLEIPYSSSGRVRQEDLLTKCKIISSWYEFTAALKKQFYPLGYIHQAMMDWKNLRHGKGQNVQEYT